MLSKKVLKYFNGKAESVSQPQRPTAFPYPQSCFVNSGVVLAGKPQVLETKYFNRHLDNAPNFLKLLLSYEVERQLD